MNWFLVLRALLVLLLSATGGGKLAGSAASLQIRDSLGIAPRVWRAIGMFEIVLVVGLLFGFAVPPVAGAAYAGVCLLMLGALVARARVGGPAQRGGIIADLVVLTLASVLAFLAP